MYSLSISRSLAFNPFNSALCRLLSSILSLINFLLRRFLRCLIALPIAGNFPPSNQVARKAFHKLRTSKYGLGSRGREGNNHNYKSYSLSGLPNESPQRSFLSTFSCLSCCTYSSKVRR